MRFFIRKSCSSFPNSTLIYKTDELSFDVEPKYSDGFASILINDLNIELNADGKVISIWGFCPFHSWKSADVNPPDADVGELFVVTDQPLKSGVSIRVDENIRWMTLVDISSGWVRMTSSLEPVYTSARQEISSIKIMIGVIIDLTVDGQILAIWLHPKELPTMEK